MLAKLIKMEGILTVTPKCLTTFTNIWENYARELHVHISKETKNITHLIIYEQVGRIVTKRKILSLTTVTANKNL